MWTYPGQAKLESFRGKFRDVYTAPYDDLIGSSQVPLTNILLLCRSAIS